MTTRTEIINNTWRQIDGIASSRPDLADIMPEIMDSLKGPVDGLNAQLALEEYVRGFGSADGDEVVDLLQKAADSWRVSRDKMAELAELDDAAKQELKDIVRKADWSEARSVVNDAVAQATSVAPMQQLPGEVVSLIGQAQKGFDKLAAGDVDDVRDDAIEKALAAADDSAQLANILSGEKVYTNGQHPIFDDKWRREASFKVAIGGGTLMGVGGALAGAKLVQLKFGAKATMLMLGAGGLAGAVVVGGLAAAAIYYYANAEE